jgi:cytoskeleton protein RodZ
LSISHKNTQAEKNIAAESANRAPPSLGSMLRQAREAASMSQGELARQLNLGARVVESMEQEDMTALPGAVYVHGYLRKWAEALNLDETQLKQAYTHLVGESRKADMRHIIPIEPMRIKTATSGFPWFKILFFIGIIVLGFLATRYMPESWRLMDSPPAPAPSGALTTAPLPPPVQIPLSLPTPPPPVVNKPIRIPGIVAGEVVKSPVPHAAPDAAQGRPTTSTPGSE